MLIQLVHLLWWEDEKQQSSQLKEVTFAHQQWDAGVGTVTSQQEGPTVACYPWPPWVLYGHFGLLAQSKAMQERLKNHTISLINPQKIMLGYYFLVNLYLGMLGTSLGSFFPTAWVCTSDTCTKIAPQNVLTHLVKENTTEYVHCFLILTLELYNCTYDVCFIFVFSH